MLKYFWNNIFLLEEYFTIFQTLFTLTDPIHSIWCVDLDIIVFSPVVSLF